MRLFIVGLIVTVLMVPCNTVFAESDKTIELSYQASNLDQHRDEVEKKLASEQVKVYRLAQRVQALEKQLDEMKKAAEKPAEKKAE